MHVTYLFGNKYIWLLNMQQRYYLGRVTKQGKSYDGLGYRVDCPTVQVKMSKHISEQALISTLRQSNRQLGKSTLTDIWYI